MPGNLLPQLFTGIPPSAVHQLYPGQHQPRRAESALNSGLIHEGLLHRMEEAVFLPDALYGNHTVPISPSSQIKAAVDGLAV